MQTQRYKVHKRFRDFDSLNQVLRLKFINLSFVDIPSKTQIIGREKTRMEYFRKLMDQILHYAASYGGAGTSQTLKVKLLKVLYSLLMIDAIPVKVLTCEDSGRTSTFRSTEGFNGLQ